MGEQVKQYAWLLQLINILILPVAMWYGYQIKEAHTMAATAQKAAYECKSDLQVACANAEAEKQRINYLWNQYSAHELVSQEIMKKLSILETHISYIKENMNKRGQRNE